MINVRNSGLEDSTRCGHESATLQDAVDAAESIGDLMQDLAVGAWRPTRAIADRQNIRAETLETCHWATVVLRRAIDVAETAVDETALGSVYGRVTRLEALAHFNYLLDSAMTQLAAV
jgi:hypothetical protein